MNKRSKILWGVCGIGHGHTFRQLPLIDHFAASADIMIFAYGESLAFFRQYYAETPHVRIAEVAVPFYVGNKDGIDFEASAERPENQLDFKTINGQAMALAQEFIGKPDLVISDYEPVSAQYAYGYDAPLVTLDQQSKYLSGDFPEELNGHGFKDEVQRLGMFFPKAEKRLACSFFKVATAQNAAETVDILPPVLHDKITDLTRRPDESSTSILVYLSSQQPFGQSFEDINAILAGFPEVTFHIFGKDIPPMDGDNIHSHKHGSRDFHDILGRCSGIVSTAGHSLISEAMYLGIPVYAIPLPLYEQQMNADVIDKNGFGISRPELSRDNLSDFIENLGHYHDNINNDHAVLLRENGRGRIIASLSAYL